MHDFKKMVSNWIREIIDCNRLHSKSLRHIFKPLTEIISFQPLYEIDEESGGNLDNRRNQTIIGECEDVGTDD